MDPAPFRSRQFGLYSEIQKIDSVVAWFDMFPVVAVSALYVVRIDGQALPALSGNRHDADVLHVSASISTSVGMAETENFRMGVVVTGSDVVSVRGELDHPEGGCGQRDDSPVEIGPHHASDMLDGAVRCNRLP